MKEKSFHLILSGKGGVGKSVVARLNAEYLTERSGAPLCLDVDPANASFAAVEAFGARAVDLLDEDDKINASRFDDMIDDILDSDRSVVIDSGSSSYFQLVDYIADNDMIPELQDAGYDVYLHCVVTGGAGLEFTASNFAELATWYGDRVNLVVWINHFWEKVIRGGKPFTEWPMFLENEDRVAAVLEIPRMTADTTRADFSRLLKENLSFAQATARDSGFNTMARSRMKKVRRVMFGAMDDALGICGSALHAVDEAAGSAKGPTAEEVANG